MLHDAITSTEALQIVHPIDQEIIHGEHGVEAIVEALKDDFDEALVLRKAAYLSACRWTDQRSPDAPMALGPALGSFLVCAGSGLWAICVRPAYPSTTAWLPILAISFCLGFLEAIATRPVAHVVGAANGSRTP